MRISLSKEVENRMIAQWNAAHPTRFPTHDKITEYYQAAGYDLNWRQRRESTPFWPGSRIIYTLPKNQLDFFLLSL